MTWIAAYLYLVGCLAALQYADVLQDKPGLTAGSCMYILCWPVAIPAIWLLAFIEVVNK